MIGQGTGGFTEPIERRIVLPFAGPLAETDHVIGHELVHAFQFDITGKHDLKKGGLPAAAKCHFGSLREWQNIYLSGQKT